MATFLKKSLVMVAAVMAIAMSAVAPVSAAGSPYDDRTYYEDGFVDQYGQFRPYDYDYYHQDGYRYDSYYGTESNYDAAMARYRYVRDRAYYNDNYSAYYDNYNDYARDLGYNYYGYGNYDYNYDYSYDYPDNWYVTRGTPSYSNYDYSYDYPYGNYASYTNDYYGDYYYGDSYYGGGYYDDYVNYGNYYDKAYFGCSRYDAECQYHKARDLDGDYTYIQYGPDKYVRSDYYNSDYANMRDNYLRSPYYRYY